MDFRLLGPVEATVGSTAVELRGRKQRALLARLLLDPGRVVALDQLVDDLWGEHTPDSAVKMVHIYVSQLRKALPGEVLRTSAPGYVADVSPTAVDVVRFTDLRERGASALGSGNLRAAARLLGDALGLWRGPALAGLAEPFADAERRHLEERRLECLEDRVDAELGLGRHNELVAELTALAARHPLRERPQRQLMLALYRSGRHAEALEVYRAFRRRLDEELGMEPPAALRELEARMLRQDPALAPPERLADRPRVITPAPPPPPPPRPAAEDRRPSEIRYARSGDASIAYQVFGEGELTIMFVPGFVSHIEVLWDDPATARFFDRLATFARVVLHDKREQGLSDRLGRAPSLEESAADIVAVMDAVGCERAALLGISEGGPLAVTAAATHPERVAALVVYGTWPRLTTGDGYELGIPPRLLDAWHRELLRDWGGALTLELFAPTLAADPRFVAWWGRLLRAGTSPSGAARLFDLHRDADVRPLLADVRAPTLVLHRDDDLLCPVAGGRYLAEHIPGARFASLTGADHLWMAGDQDELLDEVEEFLTGRRSAREPERVLQTVLFMDIVGSTRHAGDVGDRRWRDLLAAYDARVARQLERHDGRLVKQLGDGTLAAFDQPARGIRCARAIRRDVAELGLELRAGVHTGECEIREGDLAGLAVHIGARVGASAEPGELLVSSTVKDLVAGSELRFSERGTRELRGVPGTWTLFAVEDDG